MDLLQGSVAERPFPKVIYALVAHAFTGALTLEQQGKSWVLWWTNGQVVDADSATPEDALGRVLRENGLIDAGQLSESLRRMAQNPGLSQFAALQQMGALSGDAAVVAARTGLVRRALRVFALAEASYKTEARAHDRAEGGPLDGRWLIYRGLRAHYDAARLGRELAPIEPYALKLPGGQDQTLGLFGFGDEERYVVQYLAKGYWCLPDLVDACVSLPEPTVHSLVYALLACELLDVKPGNAVPRLRKRARETTLSVNASKPSTPPTRTSIPPPDAPATPPSIVSRGAPAAPTQRPAAAAPAPAARPASAAPAPAASAAATPEVREQILRKFKEVEAGADLFAVLELPKNASAGDVKAGYFRLAKTFHPDRVASLKVEDLRPQVERVFARMSEAFSVLGDDARRAEYLKVQAQGGEEAVRKKEAEEQALALKILAAEEQFRNGEMALRRNQFPEALAAFKAALEGNPDEAEHHAMVAWATFMSSPDKDAALPTVKHMFARALELNKNCVPAYFYLGHIYNHQQDYPRALAQFKRALELRPGYVDAEREIRLIETRSAKGQLGKSSQTLNPFRKR
jgi:curved DNA-binding protein CbpA